MQNIQTIEPRNSIFRFHFKELWQYRDLLILFIRREIVVVYKQTVLGPLWFFIQPLLTTLMFTVVFGRIAGISTDGIPGILFYLSGITLWNYFAESLRLTSDTFKKNAPIFGKVYFPRIIMPMAIVFSNLVKFGIQFLLFIGFYFYYILKGAQVTPNTTLLLVPVYVIITAGLGLGFGLIISALTTKYRDFTFLVQFGVQLWMYATPIIYPLSTIEGKYKIIFMLNPMTGLVESFKYGFFSAGSFSFQVIIYPAVFMLITLLMGILIFNKVEKNFMDTV